MTSPFICHRSSLCQYLSLSSSSTTSIKMQSNSPQHSLLFHSETQSFSQIWLLISGIVLGEAISFVVTLLSWSLSKHHGSGLNRTGLSLKVMVSLDCGRVRTLAFCLKLIAIQWFQLCSQLILSVCAGIIPGALYGFESQSKRCLLLLSWIYVGQLLIWILYVSIESARLSLKELKLTGSTLSPPQPVLRCLYHYQTEMELGRPQSQVDYLLLLLYYSRISLGFHRRLHETCQFGTSRLRIAFRSLSARRPEEVVLCPFRPSIRLFASLSSDASSGQVQVSSFASVGTNTICSADELSHTQSLFLSELLLQFQRFSKESGNDRFVSQFQFLFG